MIDSLAAVFRPTFVMISQNRADAKRHVIVDQQRQTVKEEDTRNGELLTLSNEFLKLTQAVDVATSSQLMYESVRERKRRGKAARGNAPRSSHAALPLSEPRDPLALLADQDRTRLAELVPIRYKRMRASPLSFFRGASTVMAGDLAATPVSGLSVQLSGDAHLLNFGGFASPERALVFDLNDFDETLGGPFEWDVKRLATSFEIAARDRDFAAAERKRAVRTAVRSYRVAMRQFAEMGDLDVWYSHLDAESLNADMERLHDRKLERKLRHSEATAYRHDNLLAASKLTHDVNGTLRFVSRPPLVVPVEKTGLEKVLQELFARYLRTLSPDRRTLLERFRYVDLARKVVGIGSVGTRCWILLLVGRDEQDPLVLQIKEAQASVLEAPLAASSYMHGERVVEGQRVMQAAGDIFLGWVHSDEDIDGGARDFYVRQLWDWKVSVELETISPRGLVAYARACGWTLARAHARTGDRIAIAAYLGAGDNFDAAVGEFAAAYADLNERDHAAIVARCPRSKRRRN